ncbi:hypothetical protein [Nocardia abscessus]|uniref:hypothetical protein n=1 Tax=Nocardia abscessus TaxID=120957 RepID=UPI0024583ABD|nr:hypothetical protein [Nocardia abscessus]
MGSTGRSCTARVQKCRLTVGAPSRAAIFVMIFWTKSSNTLRKDRVVVIAAASTAGAVGGNSHAHRISSASQARVTMTVILVAWISVPMSNALSPTVLISCASASRD